MKKKIIVIGFALLTILIVLNTISIFSTRSELRKLEEMFNLDKDQVRNYKKTTQPKEESQKESNKEEEKAESKPLSFEQQLKKEVGDNFQDHHIMSCDLLNDKEILYFKDGCFDCGDGAYLITSDYKIYDITMGYIDNNKTKRLFSNNQQCIEHKIDLKIDDITFDNSEGRLLHSNNKCFVDLEFKNNYCESTYYDNVLRRNKYSYIEEKGNPYSTNYYEERSYVALKNGEIHLLKMRNTYSNNSYKTISDNILIKKDKYGNIKFINNMYELVTQEGKVKISRNARVFTDKGLYTAHATNEEECTKYSDIECNYELKLSEKREKLRNSYKDKIRYEDTDYMVIQDNNNYYFVYDY